MFIALQQLHVVFCEIKGPLNILGTHVCYSLTLQLKIQPVNK